MYVYMCVCVCTEIYTLMYMNVCIKLRNTYMCIYVYIHIDAYVHICVSSTSACLKALTPRTINTPSTGL